MNVHVHVCMYMTVEASQTSLTCEGQAVRIIKWNQSLFPHLTCPPHHFPFELRSWISKLKS